MMKILTDVNVDEMYVSVLEQADWITIQRSVDVLAHSEDDVDISKFAEKNDWVVLTKDTDFRQFDHHRGLIILSSRSLPTPGELITEIRKVDGIFTDHREIDTFIPGEWL